jgi:NADH dehydrogenase
MKVVITGANGAVGNAILAQGLQDSASSLTLVAAVRSARAASELPPLPADRVARVSYDDVASLRAAFQGASAVIHLVGVLIEQPGFSYEVANVETTRKVVQAAVDAGVKKIVHISAVDSDERSSNRYWRSKAQAEELVRKSGLAFTILRVPLLLGPKTEGAAALVRHLSRPVAMIPGGGRHLQQPLDVDDLARAALRAVDLSVAPNATLNLIGPVSLPDRELLQRAAKALGREVKVRSIPIPLVRLALQVKRMLGKPGLSPDVLEVITANTQFDSAPAANQLGIRLTGIDEMIRRSLP